MVKLLIAGSRYSSGQALEMARLVVARCSVLDWEIIVGDCPFGVDKEVIEAAEKMNVKANIFGPSLKGRYTGWLWEYHQLGKTYSERDRLMVDLCDRAFYIWNGKSRGTHEGYEYALSIGKQADIRTL